MPATTNSARNFAAEWIARAGVDRSVTWRGVTRVDTYIINALCVDDTVGAGGQSVYTLHAPCFENSGQALEFSLSQHILARPRTAGVMAVRVDVEGLFSCAAELADTAFPPRLPLVPDSMWLRWLGPQERRADVTAQVRRLFEQGRAYMFEPHVSRGQGRPTDVWLHEMGTMSLESMARLGRLMAAEAGAEDAAPYTSYTRADGRYPQSRITPTVRAIENLEENTHMPDETDEHEGARAGLLNKILSALPSPAMLEADKVKIAAQRLGELEMEAQIAMQGLDASARAMARPDEGQPEALRAFCAFWSTARLPNGAYVPCVSVAAWRAALARDGGGGANVDVSWRGVEMPSDAGEAVTAFSGYGRTGPQMLVMSVTALCSSVLSHMSYSLETRRKRAQVLALALARRFPLPEGCAFEAITPYTSIRVVAFKQKGVPVSAAQREAQAAWRGEVMNFCREGWSDNAVLHPVGKLFNPAAHRACGEPVSFEGTALEPLGEALDTKSLIALEDGTIWRVPSLLPSPPPAPPVEGSFGPVEAFFAAGGRPHIIPMTDGDASAAFCAGLFRYLAMDNVCVRGAGGVLMVASEGDMSWMVFTRAFSGEETRSIISAVRDMGGLPRRWRRDGSAADTPSVKALSLLPLLKTLPPADEEAARWRSPLLHAKARVWLLPARPPFSKLPPLATEGGTTAVKFARFGSSDVFTGSLMARKRSGCINVAVIQAEATNENAVFDLDTNLDVEISTSMEYVKVHGEWTRREDGRINLSHEVLGARRIVVTPGDDINLLYTHAPDGSAEHIRARSSAANKLRSITVDQRDSWQARELARVMWGLCRPADILPSDVPPLLSGLVRWSLVASYMDDIRRGLTQRAHLEGPKYFSEQNMTVNIRTCVYWANSKPDDAIARGDRAIIAYFKNEDDAERHRLTVTTPARWLVAMFPELKAAGAASESLIARVSAHCEAAFTRSRAKVPPPPLLFADTEDEIVGVYAYGPDSCMSGHPNEHHPAYRSGRYTRLLGFKGGQMLHPAMVYAALPGAAPGTFLSCAYMARLQEGETMEFVQGGVWSKHADGSMPKERKPAIIARAMVDKAKMLYGRLYGDQERLRNALRGAGYTQGRVMSAPVRLRHVPYGEGILMPYVDSGFKAEDGSAYIYRDHDSDTFGVTYEHPSNTARLGRAPYDQASSTNGFHRPVVQWPITSGALLEDDDDDDDHDDDDDDDNSTVMTAWTAPDVMVFTDRTDLEDDVFAICEWTGNSILLADAARLWEDGRWATVHCDIAQWYGAPSYYDGDGESDGYVRMPVRGDTALPFLVRCTETRYPHDPYKGTPWAVAPQNNIYALFTFPGSDAIVERWPQLIHVGVRHGTSEQECRGLTKMVVSEMESGLELPYPFNDVGVAGASVRKDLPACGFDGNVEALARTIYGICSIQFTNSGVLATRQNGSFFLLFPQRPEWEDPAKFECKFSRAHTNSFTIALGDQISCVRFDTPPTIVGWSPEFNAGPQRPPGIASNTTTGEAA